MNFSRIEKAIKAGAGYVSPRRHRAYRSIIRERRIASLELKELIATEDKVAVFRLSNLRWHDDRGRYAYLLIKSFAVAGYAIVLYPQFHFLSRLTKYKALLRSLDFRVIAPRETGQWQLPHDSVSLYQSGKRKAIRLVWATAAQAFSDKLRPMPYFMHPLMYDEPLPKPDEPPTLRRIFFAGNTTPKNYQRSILADRYHKLNRVATLRQLEQHLAPNEITRVTREEQLDEPKDGANRVVIVRTEDYPINPKEWLVVLARSDFFLACPGAHMPMCHNAIEAMAVGVIPFLQYAEYFHPPLQAGKNCVTYRDEGDLIRQTKHLLQLPASEVQHLKENVTTYYQTYLHPPAWVGRLAQHPAEEVSLVVNAYEFPTFAD